MEEHMLRERVRSNSEREAGEHLDELLSALEAWRKDFYNFAAERAEHGARSGSDVLKTGRQQVRNIAGKVEERPFVSLAVAFATGLMIWGLLRR
jgi:ElaB/YqjD/DUF883 family membrane-anchored ribosome-binding protein